MVLVYHSMFVTNLLSAMPKNYNLQHIEEDSQELEGAAKDNEDVED